jgi:hypothetical protein
LFNEHAVMGASDKDHPGAWTLLLANHMLMNGDMTCRGRQNSKPVVPILKTELGQTKSQIDGLRH